LESYLEEARRFYGEANMQKHREVFYNLLWQDYQSRQQAERDILGKNAK
jgi:hypothetical protein